MGLENCQLLRQVYRTTIVSNQSIHCGMKNVAVLTEPINSRMVGKQECDL